MQTKGFDLNFGLEDSDEEEEEEGEGEGEEGEGDRDQSGATAVLEGQREAATGGEDEGVDDEEEEDDTRVSVAIEDDVADDDHANAEGSEDGIGGGAAWANAEDSEEGGEEFQAGVGGGGGLEVTTEREERDTGGWKKGEWEEEGEGSDGGSDYNAGGEEDGAGAQADGAESERRDGRSHPPNAGTSRVSPPRTRVILRKKPKSASSVAPRPLGSLDPAGAPQQTQVGSFAPGGASVKDVAAHYSQRENQRKDVRESSPIIHLKKLNNWVKSVLIRRYTRPGDSVLDLACGKGGDLIKWQYAKIGFYLGVDVARGSIYDASERYNGESSDESMPPRQFEFPAKLVCADCFGCPLDQELAEFGPFDVCSCQFALHYSFQTEERARQALRNVSGLLSPGAYFVGTIPDANVIVKKLRKSPGLKFGNLVYSIEFDAKFASKRFPAANPFGIEYLFNLEDAVACPEWLIPFPNLQELAEEYELELIERMNFHEFIEHYANQEELAQIMRRVVGSSWHTKVTPDEWDASYLYCAFVFRKKGEKQVIGKRNRQAVPLSKINHDDILFL